METLAHETEYRGQDLMSKMARQRITMCGAGALGSNMAENLLRQGFKSMSVIDFDRVEDHNRHTQIYGVRDIGQLKITALRNYLYNATQIPIQPIAKKMEESNIRKMFLNDSLVIDTFDNVESRGLVTRYCKENSIDCLHVGMYEAYAEVCWNEDYRIPDEVKGRDICEYPLARNIILLAVAVASEAIINYLDAGKKDNYDITLGDKKIIKR